MEESKEKVEEKIETKTETIASPVQSVQSVRPSSPSSEQRFRPRTDARTGTGARPPYKPRFAGGGRRSFYSRKRFCLLCKKDLYDELDYKNELLLRRFITEKGKILPRRISGLCARAQRLVKREIKRARMVAILPFTQK